MTHPTTEQLNDPKWWDENAPVWAKSYGLAGDQRVPVWFNVRQYQHVEGVQALVVFAFSDTCTFGLEEIERIAGRPVGFADEKGYFYIMREDDCSTAIEGDSEYLPDPGTEALATWLEPPDGGDRRPERVLVKGYYTHTDDREQVWFTTREGEDLVHLTENILFEPLPSVRNELKRLIADSEHYGHDYVTDAILSRFDVSFKE